MSSAARWVYGACVLGCLVFITSALRFWGSAEIRANPGEVVFLSGAAVVCLLLTTKLFAWFGLSFRDDAVERKNTAALIALSGAIIAAALLYAGGSIGEGPSYLNNVFSIGIAAVIFFVLWSSFETVSKVSISIAEERDLASGMRLGGLLIAIALVLGRAVAGDWHSESATIHDFIHDGWLAILIVAFAAFVEILARPSRLHPFRPWLTFGFIPALAYLGLAGVWLWHLGPWEGMPK